MTASRPSSNGSDIDGSDALEQALALHSMPGNARLLRERPLPPGSVLQLIRIAGGDRDALVSATDSTGETPGRIVEAAVLYIQQVFFHDAADCYRTLGVNPDASGDTIKEHYRRLMRWLHPDRNPGRSETVYSERVNRAWNSLSTEQRRREYDARPSALMVPLQDTMPAAVPQSRSFASAAAPSRIALSPRTIRWMPAIVFGVIAVLACVVMLAAYQSRLVEQADAVSAEARLDAARPNDDDSAQKAAIRERIAFEEHAAALGQSLDRPEPVARSEAADGHASATAGAAAGATAASHATSELSREFAAAYAGGDLNRMLDLFTSDAVSNHGGIVAIADDYGSLFDATSSRALNLDGLKWTVSVDRIVGSGEFTARILVRDELLARHVKGWIRIEAIPVDGHWKIQRIERISTQ